MPSTAKLLRLGLVVCFTLALGIVADLILLYVPTGNYQDPGYTFLQKISNKRLFWGSFLGFISIPFTLLGVKQLLLTITLPKLKKIVQDLSIAFVGVGMIVHVLFGIVGYGIKADPSPYYLPIIIKTLGVFSTLIVLLHILVNSLLIRYFLGPQVLFPRWLSLFNPLSIYLICVLVYFFLPIIGNYLLPIGFNLSYFIFFMLTTYFLCRKPSL